MIDWAKRLAEMEEACVKAFGGYRDIDFAIFCRVALPQAVERIRELEAALSKAADDMENAVNYVPEYFQDKYEMADDIKAARAALGKVTP